MILARRCARMRTPFGQAREGASWRTRSSRARTSRPRRGARSTSSVMHTMEIRERPDAAEICARWFASAGVAGLGALLRRCELGRPVRPGEGHRLARARRQHELHRRRARRLRPPDESGVGRRVLDRASRAGRDARRRRVPPQADPDPLAGRGRPRRRAPRDHRAQRGEPARTGRATTGTRARASRSSGSSLVARSSAT